MRKTTLTAAAAAALLAAAPALVARADVLAGGPVYGYPQQDQFAGCFLFNAGPTAVALSGLAIVGPTGAIGPGQNSCGPSLAPGQLCGLVAGIPRQGPYACTVTTPAGAGAYLRGSVGVGDLLDPSRITVPLQLAPSG